MKYDNFDEAILILGIVVFMCLFFYMSFYFIHVKNLMCVDFGNKVYGHALDWLQCLVL